MGKRSVAGVGKCGLRVGLARGIPSAPFEAENFMEWHIQSRSRVCHHTGKAFADGDTCHTVLAETPAGFERLDLSADAWKELAAEIAARPGIVSHWKGVYETPPAAPPDAIGKDDAESLLRKILARHEEKYAQAAYILAVMLERKRIIKVKAQTRENGKRIFHYEHPRSGDLFTIPDPDLQLEQLGEVEKMVTDLLEHGLPVEGAVTQLTSSEIAPTDEAAVSEGQPSASETPGGVSTVETDQPTT